MLINKFVIYSISIIYIIFKKRKNYIKHNSYFIIMIEVLQEELNTLKNQHHQEVCVQKEFNDSTFGDKVRTRAYMIWCNTRRNDSQSNYYQALEELRKELCDCEEYLKHFKVVKEKRKYIAELMGHSSTDMIEKVYQHTFPSAMEEFKIRISNNIEKLFGQ